MATTQGRYRPARRPSNPKNCTPYPELDTIADDPRIERIWTEREPYGVWADIASGWNFEGCSTLHTEWEPEGRGDYEETPSRASVRTMLTRFREDYDRLDEGDPC